MEGAAMNSVLSLICRVITVLLFVCIAGMTLIMMSLVLSRYLFSYSAPWSEEATRYLMVWMVMMGGAVLVLFDDHITLHLLAGKLGPRQALVHNILVRAVVCTVSLITAWTGYGFAFSMWNVMAPGSGLRMTIPIISIPICMTLAAAFALLLIVRDLMSLFGKTPPNIPEQSTYMDTSFRPIDEGE